MPCTTAAARRTRPPKAAPMHWWPRHTPSTGRRPAKARMASSDDARLVGRAGARRDQQVGGPGGLDRGHAGLVVARHRDLGAQRAQQLHEVVGERVVVVYDEHVGHALQPPGGAANSSWASATARSRAAALFSVSDELAGRVGVGHDAGPGLGVGDAVFHDDRADADAGVEVAARREVADRPGVGPAPHGLELVDDLHGAHLGGAAHGAGRERRLQGVDRAVPFRQSTAHRRDHVDHVRVALHAHELVDLHAARHADAAEVVAPQVDQHDVLGALLVVGAQLGHEALVFGCVGAAPPRAGDRPGHDAVAVHGDQRLGRRARQAEVVEGDVVHVGAGIDGAQPAVDGERRDADRRGEALAEHDLERVAGRDVVADARHAGLEVGAAHRRPHRARDARRATVGRRGEIGRRARARGARRSVRDRQRRVGQRRRQARLDVGDARHGLPVGLVDARAGRRAVVAHGVGDDRDGVLQVVEDEHRVGQQEGHLGQAQVVGRRVGQALEVADEVVGEVAHEGAGERGQLAGRRRVRLGDQRGGGGEGVVAGRLAAHAVALDREQAVAKADHGARADAQKGVAPQPLPLLGALEQERAPRGAELEKRRDGGL